MTIYLEYESTANIIKDSAPVSVVHVASQQTHVGHIHSQLKRDELLPPHRPPRLVDRYLRTHIIQVPEVIFLFTASLFETDWVRVGVPINIINTYHTTQRSTCPIQFWWWLHYFCTLQDVGGRRSSRVVPIACGRIEERWRVFKYWHMKIFALDKHSVGSVIIIPRVFAQQLNDISPIGHYSATETSNASHERMVCVCWGASERAILLYAARLNYLGQHQLWGGYEGTVAKSRRNWAKILGRMLCLVAREGPGARHYCSTDLK